MAHPDKLNEVVRAFVDRAKSASKTDLSMLKGIGEIDDTKTYTVHFNVDGDQCYITCDNHHILKAVQRITTVKYQDKEYKFHLKRYIFSEKSMSYATMEGGVLTCAKGIGCYLFRKLNDGHVDLGVELEITTNCDTYVLSPGKGIELGAKWVERFNNHPKGDPYRQAQLDTVAALDSSNTGIIGLFTGCGKGDIIVALCDSFVNTKSGNCVIFTFSNKVLETLVNRFRDLGIEIPDSYDVTSRINIINPVGFLRSKLSKDEAIREHLLNCQMIVSDESHHCTCKSWSTLMSEINWEFNYGFTATADTDGGVSILPANNPPEMTVNAYEVMAVLGPSIVEETLPVPIHIFNIKCRMSQDRTVISKFQEEHPDYMIGSMYLHFRELPLAKLVKRIYVECFGNENICYIPIVQVEDGVQLCAHLNELGLETIFMSGGDYFGPGGHLPGLDLEELRSLSKEKAFKVLITTSAGVEGIDLFNLDSIIPLTGKSFKNTVQGIGRSARNSEVKCALLTDQHNYMFNKQQDTKFNIIRQHLLVESEMDLDFRSTFSE